MENPLSSPLSQPKIQIEPATVNSSLGLNKTVRFNEPQIITEQAEESRPQNLNKPAEDRVPQDPNEPVKVTQQQSKVESPEESRPPNLSEQAKDNEPQDRPTQDHRPQDFNEPSEDSKRPDSNQLAPDSAAQDLKNEAEAERDSPRKTSLDKEESLPPSRPKEPEIATTDDGPASKPSLDDAQGRPELAADHQLQGLKALTETAVEEPEQRPRDKEEAPSWISTTGVQERTTKPAKAEAPSSLQDKKCCHACGHNSLSAKRMFSWSPSQLAKATLRPKPKPQTVDKATQILPGRVPMLTKLPPKRLPPAKPKPPSADKATEISPSFEKLLKRPPPLVKKKKKEASTMTMLRACPQVNRLPNMRQPFSSHRGRSPHAAAGSPPLRVKSSQSKPWWAKSSKSGPQRVKSMKSRPRCVKSTKSMPLRVQLSSSSPSKHRMNLSFCPRKKRKFICNLYITFCDNWEEPKPCRVQRTHWEESLSACSGLYRACSAFSSIKYGRIRVSNLLLALHTLGILVTSDEMHDLLYLVNVDEHESLNFCEFLEAVNSTSPFAEITAFQDTLQAFRKMKKGTVAVKELEPVLQYLGITLSPEMVQQSLGHVKMNKNGKFDFSDFLLAAKDLQRILEEEEEEAFLNKCTIFERRPFQDVADLVDAECRRRRRYCDCLDEESSLPTCLLPILTWQESAEDAALGKQRSRTSSMDLRRSSTASPVNIIKEEAKDTDAMEVTTSQMDLSSDLKSSSRASLPNNAKGGNKDNDAPELGKPQLEPPRQNTEDPVPS